MKYIYHHSYSVLALTLLLPAISYAADSSLQNLMIGIGDFINSILIPAVLAIAFLVFVINAVRFFVIGGANEEGQTKAKALALYSMTAFVVIVSFWGIINLLVSGIGLSTDPCTSDYINRNGQPCLQTVGTGLDPNDPNLLPPYVPGQNTGTPLDPNDPNLLPPPGQTTGDGLDPNDPNLLPLPGQDTGDGLDPNDPNLLPPPGQTTGDGLDPNDPDLLPPPGQTTGDGLDPNDPNLLPPTSFTPDGEPILDDTQMAAAAETVVRDEAEEYFEDDGDMTDVFGSNTNAVKSALFADLYTLRTTAVTDRSRLEATYRLVLLDAIPQTTFDMYLNAYNAYLDEYEPAGASESPVTINDIASSASEPRPINAAVQASIKQSKDRIREEIARYELQRPYFAPSYDPDEVADNIYNREISAAERHDYLVSLIEDPNDVFSQDTSTDDLYHRVVDDINATLIFQNPSSDFIKRVIP